MKLFRSLLVSLLLLLAVIAVKEIIRAPEGMAMDLRPYAKAEARLMAADEQTRLQLWRSMTVLAYQQVGTKDPRHDVDMERLLDAIATMIVTGSYPPSLDYATCLSLATKLTAVDGSKDPLAKWAFYWLKHDTDWKEWNQATNLMRHAFADDTKAQPGGKPRYANLLMIAPTAHVIDTWGMENAAERARSLGFANELAGRISAVIVENECAQAPMSLYRMVLNIKPRHPEIGDLLVKSVDAALDKATGIELWLNAAVKAAIRKNNAWAWRGTGWASSVTAAGWEGFKRNLDEANSLVEEAYRLNPQEPLISDLGITIANATKTEVTAKEWFRRGVAATFDCMDLYKTARNFQRPRWGGSFEAMIFLGCDCVDTGRFDTKVPMNLVWCLMDAIDEGEVMKQTRAMRNVLKSERVDKALQACIAGYVAIDPSRQDEFRMIRGAYLWHCGRTDEAKRELLTIPEESRDPAQAKCWHLDLAEVLKP